MKTIDELLDELQSAAIDFGYPDYDFSAIKPARAAVDAKVKELQDRIEELERQNGEMRDKLNNPFYGVELYVKNYPSDTV